MTMTDIRLAEFIEAEEAKADRRFNSFMLRQERKLEDAWDNYSNYLAEGGWMTDVPKYDNPGDFINLDDLSEGFAEKQCKCGVWFRENGAQDLCDTCWNKREYTDYMAHKKAKGETAIFLLPTGELFIPEGQDDFGEEPF